MRAARRQQCSRYPDRLGRFGKAVTDRPPARRHAAATCAPNQPVCLAGPAIGARSIRATVCRFCQVSPASKRAPPAVRRQGAIHGRREAQPPAWCRVPSYGSAPRQVVACCSASVAAIRMTTSSELPMIMSASAVVVTKGVVPDRASGSYLSAHFRRDLPVCGDRLVTSPATTAKPAPVRAARTTAMAVFAANGSLWADISVIERAAPPMRSGASRSWRHSTPIRQISLRMLSRDRCMSYLASILSPELRSPHDLPPAWVDASC